MLFISNKALEFRTMIIVDNLINFLQYDILELQVQGCVAASCLNLMTVYYIFNLFYHLALSLNSNTQCLAVVCFRIITQPF